jgi:hypothetical protein
LFSTTKLLGALSLDMVAVFMEQWHFIFAQDILKVGPEGFGVLRAAPAVGSFLTLIVSAYVPMNKNAGLKLLGSIFAFGLCIITFGLSTIFCSLSVFVFKWCRRWNFGSDSTNYFTIKTQITCAAEFLLLFYLCRFVNELGAFESGLTLN